MRRGKVNVHLDNTVDMKAKALIGCIPGQHFLRARGGGGGDVSRGLSLDNTSKKGKGAGAIFIEPGQHC